MGLPSFPFGFPIFRFIRQEPPPVLCWTLLETLQPLATLDGFNGRHLCNRYRSLRCILPLNNGIGSPSCVRFFSHFPFYIFRHRRRKNHWVDFSLAWLCFFSFHHPLVRIYKTLNSEPASFPPYWAFLACRSIMISMPANSIYIQQPNNTIQIELLFLILLVYMTCVEPVWHYWRNLVELATCIDHVANDDEEKKWTLKEGAAHRYMSKERRTDGPSAHQHRPVSVCPYGLLAL